MKKIVLGCLSSLLISQSALAAHGAFYMGTNTSRSLWHLTQHIVMDGTKVINTELYDQDWGQRQQVFNTELLAGVKASNGSMFGAIEAWYNPNSFTINSTSDDIIYSSGISGRWGGRILAGVQHKEMTVYALLGLGQTKFTNNTTFPDEGTYGTLPGVSMASTNGVGNESTLSAGVGMSVVFTKYLDISIEYQHQSAENGVNLYDSLITYFNSIGTQTTQVSANILNIGLKYHFRPFIF